MTERAKWPDLACVVMVVSERRVGDCSTCELRYYIASRRRSALPAAVPAGSSRRPASSTAVKPARSTAETRSSARTPAGNVTRAVSVAKLTAALTPSSRFSFRSIRAAQDAREYIERLAPLLAALRQGGAAPQRVARWLLQAAPRWHPRVRDTAAAWSALLASSALLEGRRLILGNVDGERDVTGEP